MQAEAQAPEQQPQTPLASLPMLPTEHPDNTPDAHDFMAMQAGLCWQCRSPDHFLRDCPMRSRPTGTRGRYRGQIHQPTPQYNRQAVYPQAQQSHRPQHGPLNANNNNPPASQNRPADYYRPPQYRLQRVNPPSESIGSQRQKPSANEASADTESQGGSVARMVELGDVADDLANIHFDHIQAEVPNNPPIVDSGASHHLCGDLKLLSNFRLFRSPIPLKVATSGNPAYITGEGDLTFSGLDNQRVTIHGVLYCELARSTLISLAALRKANAYFAYDIKQDCYLIYSSNNILCFKCPFIPRQNKWIFPFPIPSLHHPHPVPKPSCHPVSVNPCNDMPQSEHSFCPISTELRVDLRRNAFKTPLDTEHPESNINSNSLDKNEQVLLYWHRLFGHASLQKIRQVIQEKLCKNLPVSLPKGELKCDICARSKSLNKNRLTSSDRPVSS
ncbi:uncharacterized protein PGTG_22015 [Puccinia graminis f. sp. tritici CRL 75-36-700-3]|uniref:Uncharacterized protein n=1 Tax=Puccinia graminis f. sp. tritici (strain CRL 75-36-700-3 / race SCCL) TaxID=418459 RepID=H6QT54_PUCGT|nr:uncharacterized protein PGTG_22015 [Puccinia graminis f. sp. tritici CRL 75-36-700-3]EHS64017.1 hypothetical protein PGTG_22015 [Puccinia graminis f. sp. tritici CRL 75-36-700-3]